MSVIMIDTHINKENQAQFMSARATRIPTIKRKHDDITLKHVGKPKSEVGNKQELVTPCKRRPTEDYKLDTEFQIDSSSLNSILRSEPLNSYTATPTVNRRTTLLHTPGRAISAAQQDPRRASLYGGAVRVPVKNKGINESVPMHTPLRQVPSKQTIDASLLPPPHTPAITPRNPPQFLYPATPKPAPQPPSSTAPKPSQSLYSIAKPLYPITPTPKPSTSTSQSFYPLTPKVPPTSAKSTTRGGPLPFSAQPLPRQAPDTIARKLDWQTLNEDEEIVPHEEPIPNRNVLFIKREAADSFTHQPDEASQYIIPALTTIQQQIPPCHSSIPIPAPISTHISFSSFPEFIPPPVIDDDTSHSASLISDVFANFSIFEEEEPELVELEMGLSRRPLNSSGSPSRSSAVSIPPSPSLPRTRSFQHDIARSNNPMSVTLHELDVYKTEQASCCGNSSKGTTQNSEKWRPIQVTNLCFSKGAFRVFETKGVKK